ncbi:Tetratricopeptide repeat-like superfamily protein [Prunus dulcis]|uniref:Tetratricopeptide repeat-like superfamily protein n=1 Tax=Prunus dulcis TaxID=3755 RepID=A0A4Y1RFL2_PRUDU|nr:Tetratricopeptide repeat-like superfamily protein [Prunus dulcis]
MVALPNRSIRISIQEAFYNLRASTQGPSWSYKLWSAYLHERLELVRNLPITHFQYETLNNTFERALVTIHKMPKIWILYLQTLTEQKLFTRTRRTFDRALCALPVTQHDGIWDPYLEFVSRKGIPIETSLRLYRRTYLQDLDEAPVKRT